MRFVGAAEAPLGDAAVVFSALPHGTSAGWVSQAHVAGARVIDLSADLRPGNGPVDQDAIGLPGHGPISGIYGLPELDREAVRVAGVVANPGCYATAVLLSVLPVLATGLVARGGTVSVSAASGVTGAGNSPKRELLFAEVTENCRAYAAGNDHRHLKEMRAVFERFGTDADLGSCRIAAGGAGDSGDRDDPAGGADRGSAGFLARALRRGAVHRVERMHRGVAGRRVRQRGAHLGDGGGRRAAADAGGDRGDRQPAQGSGGPGAAEREPPAGIRRDDGAARMSAAVTLHERGRDPADAERDADERAGAGRCRQDRRTRARRPAAARRAGEAPGRVGGRLVIVHGAADEVSALQRTFGVKPAFVNGLRVTSADDIDTIRMACSGLANKRLIAALIGAGIRAVGLSGEDASILVAEPAGDGALGAIGHVVSVHTPLLELLLGNGYVPAISPLARATSATTAALNIYADDAAAAIATALGADELLLVADVTHVRAYGDSVTELSQSAAEAAIAAGEIKDGMLVKVRAALGAVARGVPTARIGDVEMIAGESTGTAIVADGGLS